MAAGLLVKSTAPVAAQSAAGKEAHEETIQQVLELRRQLEELLAALPPELREEAERRWHERQAAASNSTEPPIPTPKPPSEAPVVPTPVPIDIVPEPADSEPTAPVVETADTVAAAPPCGGFSRLDTDQDGLVSGADRQWRYLRLWFDNGDDRVDETEVESLFALGVQAIDVGLGSYSVDGGQSEDVDVDQYIRLRNVGKRGQRRRIGVLVIDADRLAKDGIFTLTDGQGRILAGFQPLGGGTSLKPADEPLMPVLCPTIE